MPLATTPNANANAMVQNEHDSHDLYHQRISAEAHRAGPPDARSTKVGEGDAFLLHRPQFIVAQKRTLVHAVHRDGLVPQRFSLLMRRLSVTRASGGVSGAASMNEHRIVRRGKTACETSASLRSTVFAIGLYRFIVTAHGRDAIDGDQVCGISEDIAPWSVTSQKARNVLRSRSSD